MYDALKTTHLVKEAARRHGFDACGISTAEYLNEDARALELWLKQGMHGEMAYMERNADLRLDPRKLVPGAKSVISLSYNYFPSAIQEPSDAPKIAKYAYGKDYHLVLKKKLSMLFDELKDKIGNIEGRCFVDSAPIMERTWAAKSGLGWIGKNSLLLTKGAGSFYFLAEIISDLDLIPDGPVKNYCGSCTKCIDACPTNAIYEPYKVDGSKCISYFTIELKAERLPDDMKDKMEHWAFGCDICQDVCPINARAKASQEPQFKPDPRLLQFTKNDWQQMNEEIFHDIFKHSAVKRTKFSGLKRNIDFLYSASENKQIQ
jgi:epoxyqueuosine reductase